MIIINSLGLQNVPLIRKQEDRIVNFGTLIYDNENNCINDYIINLPNHLKNIVQTLFSISFDIKLKKYFLSPNLIDNYIETNIFVKVIKNFKIDKKLFVSLGEVHFIIEPINDNKSIIIEANLELNLNKKYYFDSENIKKITMGREKNCNIILNHLSYSRIQCSINYNENDNFWFINDGDNEKESTNGTWVFINWDYDIEKDFLFRIGQNIIQVNLNKYKE